MAEWSYLRAIPRTPEKFFAQQINVYHDEFLAGDLDLTTYLEHLSEFLERENAEADVFAFLVEAAHQIGAGTFGPKIDKLGNMRGRFVPLKGKFSTFLKKRWSAWCTRSGVARPVLDEGDLSIVQEAPAAPAVAATKSNIEAAYREYLDRAEGADERLFSLVIRFATLRATDLLFQSPNINSLADDVAQDSTIDVWKTLSNFKGEPGQFYKWLRCICSGHSVDALNANVKSSKQRVPLQVDDERNPGCMDDNPALYHEEKLTYARELPDFIQGSDLQICDYIREGLNYSQIGQVLQITEAAVERRIARMRQRIKPN